MYWKRSNRTCNYNSRMWTTFTTTKTYKLGSTKPSTGPHAAHGLDIADLDLSVVDLTAPTVISNKSYIKIIICRSWSFAWWLSLKNVWPLLP